jgi:hypothetical protein
VESNKTPDHSLAALVEEVFAFGKKQASPDGMPEVVPVPPKMIPAQPHQTGAQILLESARPPDSIQFATQRKELKRASELAAMIEFDLAQHPECPKLGFSVTVYGATDWRAMLTITPAAGRIREPQKWRDLTEELAGRLRQRYDLAWD